MLHHRPADGSQRESDQSSSTTDVFEQFDGPARMITYIYIYIYIAYIYICILYCKIFVIFIYILYFLSFIPVKEKDEEEGQAFAPGPTRVAHSPVSSPMFVKAVCAPSCFSTRGRSPRKTSESRGHPPPKWRRGGPNKRRRLKGSLETIHRLLEVSKDATGPSRRSGRKNKG